METGEEATLHQHVLRVPWLKPVLLPRCPNLNEHPWSSIVASFGLMGAKCMFLNSSLPGTFHPKLYAPSKTRCFGVRSNPVRNGSKHDHCEPCCRKNRGSFLVPSFKLALHLHRHHQVWHNNYSCHDETDIYIYTWTMKYIWNMFPSSSLSSPCFCKAVIYVQ